MVSHSRGGSHGVKRYMKERGKEEKRKRQEDMNHDA
jgi:hypothetical protein